MERKMMQGFKSYPVWFLLLLAGCAAPQKPVYDFTPPASKAGLACLQRCQAQSAACERKVDRLANQCAVNAGRKAKTELPGRIAAYENSLADWEKAVRRYERDVSLYELQVRHHRFMNGLAYADCRDDKGKKSRHCHRRSRLWRSPFWSGRPVYPGKAPKRPTLKSVRSEIVGKECSQQKTQCTANYRQCYVQCGGTVKVR